MFGLSALETKLIGGGIVLALLAAVFGALTVERNHWKHVATERTEEVAKMKAAFDQTVAGYRDAAQKAQAEDAANKLRVELSSQKNNEEIKSEYEARISAARATHDRVRDNQAATTNPSSSSTASVPGVPTTARGTNETSCEVGLPNDDALIATEQAIQLDELQKWVLKEHSIDVNGDNIPITTDVGKPTTDTVPAPSPDAQ